MSIMEREDTPSPSLSGNLEANLHTGDTLSTENAQNSLGFIQVYTGNGKGKTTAAWGLALRSVGNGLKVAVVQFLKLPNSGERIAAREHIPELTVIGETRPYNVNADISSSDICREDSRRIFEDAKGLILSGDFDMVVLDEMNVVLHYGFVSQGELMDLLRSRPTRTELVFTGRYAPDWLIETAQLVTEMRDVKHPSRQGVKARKGIER